LILKFEGIPQIQGMKFSRPSLQDNVEIN